MSRCGGWILLRGGAEYRVLKTEIRSQFDVITRLVNHICRVALCYEFEYDNRFYPIIILASLSFVLLFTTVYLEVVSYILVYFNSQILGKEKLLVVCLLSINERCEDTYLGKF